MPRGEDGPVAEHAPGAGGGPSDQAPGQPGTDGFQVAGNDPADGGFGVGGWGFGGGGGGNGGGGVGGGGGSDGGGTGGGGTPGGGTGGGPVDTTFKPSPDDTPPVQTVTTPAGPDNGGDNPVCVLSSGCDLTPPPPRTDDPAGDGDFPNPLPSGEPNGAQPGAIPEPASWLMMIVGFMGLGAVLRAQRRKAKLV